jgi:PhnB protein
MFIIIDIVKSIFINNAIHIYKTKRWLMNMKTLFPHIYLKNCQSALDYYVQIFGGEIKNTQLSDGIEMFKGHEGKLIHAELHINDRCILYFADVFGQVESGNHIWLSINLESYEELEAIYNAFAQDGHIKMELQDTFWGSKYAVVNDKFGLTWELSFSN